MEFLNPETMAVLGTPIGFIAYLIYKSEKQQKQIEFWMAKAFEASRESSKELYETIQLTERMMRMKGVNSDV